MEGQSCMPLLNVRMAQVANRKVRIPAGQIEGPLAGHHLQMNGHLIAINIPHKEHCRRRKLIFHLRPPSVLLPNMLTITDLSHNLIALLPIPLCQPSSTATHLIFRLKY